jgi:hypothetical protein
MKMNMTKRVLIFSLAFLVLFNSVGVFLATYIETGFHRSVEYSTENTGDSELLSMTVYEFDSIVWIGERDFVYKTNVYDCESISSQNGKINLKCHSDSEETNLKNSVALNFDNGIKNIPTSKSVKEFFKVFPVFENSVAIIISFPYSFSFDYCSHDNQLPRSVVLALNVPPPENC